MIIKNDVTAEVSSIAISGVHVRNFQIRLGNFRVQIDRIIGKPSNVDFIFRISVYIPKQNLNLELAEIKKF